MYPMLNRRNIAFNIKFLITKVLCKEEYTNFDIVIDLLDSKIGGFPPYLLYH